MDVAETTALATALTGRRFDAAEAELLYDATGGFPLYVVEAARSVDQDKSGASSGQLFGWMGILPKRIQQLSPAGRELAGLAAALGRDFSIPPLTSMPYGRDRDERELTLLEMSIPPLNALHGYSSPLVRRPASGRSVSLTSST